MLFWRQVRTFAQCALAAVLLALTPQQVLAVDGQNSTPDGESFASACAGTGFSSVPQAGDAFGNGVSNTQRNCQKQTTTGGGTAAVTASNGNASYSNAATGSATQGIIKLNASNAETAPITFTGANTNAGWNEAITLSQTGQSGQAAWVIPIDVVGLMQANGSGSRGIAGVQAYRNHSRITGSGSSLNAAAKGLFDSINTKTNGTILFSFDYEAVYWGVTDRGAGDPQNTLQLDVDQMVQFVVPFTWGVSFDLGIFANLNAAESSSGSTDNSTSLDFDSTVAWAGPGYALNFDGSVLGADQIVGFDITSTSGTDYTQSFVTSVPEPATLGLFALAVALVGVAHRRRINPLLREVA